MELRKHQNLINFEDGQTLYDYIKYLRINFEDGQTWSLGKHRYTYKWVCYFLKATQV